MYYVLIRFKINLRSNICKLNLIALRLNLLHSFYIWINRENEKVCTCTLT